MLAANGQAAAMAMSCAQSANRSLWNVHVAAGTLCAMSASKRQGSRTSDGDQYPSSQKGQITTNLWFTQGGYAHSAVLLFSGPVRSLDWAGRVRAGVVGAFWCAKCGHTWTSKPPIIISFVYHFECPKISHDKQGSP
jgi:hypothetical protein